MNLVVNINATLIVFPEPLLLVERLKTNEICPVCESSRFSVKDFRPQRGVRVECDECYMNWHTESTSKPVSAFRGDITARTGIEDIMSKASKARKGSAKKSSAVDALIADKKTAAGQKPKTATIKKSETKAGRGASMDAKRFKVGSTEGLRVGSNGEVIAKAFGKGSTVADAVSALQKDFKPGRSKAYEDNPRAFIVGYVSHLVKNGVLVEA